MGLRALVRQSRSAAWSAGTALAAGAMLVAVVGSLVAIATGWLVSTFESGWHLSGAVFTSILSWGLDNGPGVIVATPVAMALLLTSRLVIIALFGIAIAPPVIAAFFLWDLLSRHADDS